MEEGLELSRSDRQLSLLFGLVTFSSAFLLFEIQPLISRLLLPLFGGSSAVWTTCILFFQSVLLFGYLLAYGLSRFLARRNQQLAYVGLLAVSLAAVFLLNAGAIAPPASPDDPVLDILRTLLITVGAPYLVLSSTSPLVQGWYGSALSSRIPYRLYVVSNAGSLLALLSYPLLVEPVFRLTTQRSYWNIAYAVYALLATVLILTLGRVKTFAAPEQPELEGAAIGRGAVLACIVFPMLSSILLLGFTHFLTFDVAPIPLLWVIPLSLYLLSFIICFREQRFYSRRLFFFLLAGVCFFASGDFFSGVSVFIISNVLFCLASLFICCIICHAEVYQFRPGKKDLALFYVLIAFGSALGSIFSAIIAPMIFVRFLEVPLGLLTLLMIYAFLISNSNQSIFPNYPQGKFLSEKKLLWAFCSYGFLWFYFHHEDDKSILFRERNFYGSLHVLNQEDSKKPNENHRSLINGRIVHGSAYTEAGRTTVPAVYFGANSALGAVFELMYRRPKLNIGIVGLGVGSCAAWGRENDDVRFYEINPMVPRVARTYFDFLGKTPAKNSIVMGDARLSLERDTDQQFDVLVLDAFSSDAIPIHLLTLEAMQLYLRHLKPDGILAVHVSNRHLNLEPVALSLARSLQLHAGVYDSKPPQFELQAPSVYVVVSRSGEFFQGEDNLSRLRPLSEQMIFGRLWTDDFASTLGAIRWYGMFRMTLLRYFVEQQGAPAPTEIRKDVMQFSADAPSQGSSLAGRDKVG